MRLCEALSRRSAGIKAGRLLSNTACHAKRLTTSYKLTDEADLLSALGVHASPSQQEVTHEGVADIAS